MRVEVFNETNEKLNNELDQLKKFLINVATDEKLDNIEYNVIIIDNNAIKEINKIHRGIDSETDVISFALEDDKSYNTKEIRLLGDIYISVEMVHRQSLEYSHSFKRELYFLAIHGFLHLLGYDHIEKDDEEIMFKKQKEILDKYGITR